MVWSENTKIFSPKFTHQVFQKDEIIHGYQGLFIDVFLSASTLRPCLSYYYEQKADKGADNITQIIADHFGEDCKPISAFEALSSGFD